MISLDEIKLVLREGFFNCSHVVDFTIFNSRGEIRIQDEFFMRWNDIKEKEEECKQIFLNDFINCAQKSELGCRFTT